MQDPKKVRIRRCLQRQCVSCRSRFIPNPRLRTRQKTCGKESCRRTQRAGYRRQYRIKNPQAEQEYAQKRGNSRSTAF